MTGEAPGATLATGSPGVTGTAEPRIAAVREEFERNFAERGESGASLSVMVDGAVAVPVNFRLAPPEVAYVLDDAEAKVVFVGEGFVPLVEAAKETSAGAGDRREWRPAAPRSRATSASFRAIAASTLRV